MCIVCTYIMSLWICRDVYCVYMYNVILDMYVGMCIVIECPPPCSHFMWPYLPLHQVKSP